MFVGEKASQLLTPTDPMHFELDNAVAMRNILNSHVILSLPGRKRQNADGNGPGIDICSSPEVDAEEVPGQRPSDSHAGDVLLPDYDAVASSDSDDTTTDIADEPRRDNFDSDDESSSFEAQGLEDDRRDLKEVKRPKYLRDCVKAIASQKDFQVRRRTIFFFPRLTTRHWESCSIHALFV